MHARRTGVRRRSKRPAKDAGGAARAARTGRRRLRVRPAPAARQARASERRFISSWVISRCSVFSALPGSDM